MVLPNNSRDCAIKICELTDYYSKLTEELYNLEVSKATDWPTLRKNENSDASAERAYERSENGLQSLKIKYKLKTTEKKISALKKWSEALNMEARNAY